MQRAGTFEGSTSTAFNRPLPLTSTINEQPLLCSASMAALRQGRREGVADEMETEAATSDTA